MYLSQAKKYWGKEAGRILSSNLPNPSHFYNQNQQRPEQGSSI